MTNTILKINFNLLLKQIRKVSQIKLNPVQNSLIFLNQSKIEPFVPKKLMNENGLHYIPPSQINIIINDPTKLSYVCPSNKIFKLPLNDFMIIDKLKRIELNLPEINKNKIIDDPLLKHHVGKECPEKSGQRVPISCGRSLWSEIKWRKRKMNVHKRRKMMKKLHFAIKKRQQIKEHRYNQICETFKNIQEKKSDIFEPMKFINRELEKAKFFGYRCSPIYDQFRDTITKSIKPFDEKYTRKFEDKRKPIHMLYEEKLSNKQ